MKYNLLIGILSMTTYVLPASIAQSNLNGEFKTIYLSRVAGTVGVYIIEDYDPLEAPSNISLSDKKNSVLNSTSSIEPEPCTFEEKPLNVITAQSQTLNK